MQLQAAVLREGYSVLLRGLYPACPHTTWTLWNELGYDQLPIDGVAQLCFADEAAMKPCAVSRVRNFSMPVFSRGPRPKRMCSVR